MIISILFFIYSFIISVISYTPPPVNSIPVKVVNAAGSPIELFWVSPTGERISQTEKPIKDGNEARINSYNTHQFLIKFLNGYPHSQEVTFTKGPYEETITVFNDDNTLSFEQYSKFDEFQGIVEKSTSKCSSYSGEKLTKCLANDLYRSTYKERKKNIDIAQYRDLMSARLRNYTCADPTMNTTTPISSKTVNIMNKQYHMDTYLDMDSAKIWSVSNFITPDECSILMNYGVKHLRRATVAGEDGLGTISIHRRAQQASYTIKGESDPLANLYNRVFAHINTQTRYNLKTPGQEGFTIIQYNVDDEYTPHCDGSCDGEKHMSKGRIATAVMYCKIPEIGGGTSFTKADVFVNPVPGMATFFTYRGSDGFMDVGFTEHSGCPVLKGEKWITTLWMRDGVDAEHGWEKYDPSGEPDHTTRKKKNIVEQVVSVD
mmetsp:Transcript_18122/g.18873  ORF Transcript_18122/g.18873 Transcript_18122/m.18873 type:complete len:432 (+) Transcript_18122:44-1339(+)